MPRPKTPAPQRVLAQSEWDDDHFHLIWKGKMIKDKPRLAHGPHPVRVLLELDSPRIRTKRTCNHPRCINDEHYRIYLARDNKYGDLPPPDWRHPLKGLSVHDYEEIEHLLTLPNVNLADYPARIRDEVVRRRGTTK